MQIPSTTNPKIIQYIKDNPEKKGFSGKIVSMAVNPTP
jgi:hypothetical protein